MSSATLHHDGGGTRRFALFSLLSLFVSKWAFTALYLICCLVTFSEVLHLIQKKMVQPRQCYCSSVLTLLSWIVYLHCGLLVDILLIDINLSYNFSHFIASHSSGFRMFSFVFSTCRFQLFFESVYLRWWLLASSLDSYFRRFEDLDPTIFLFLFSGCGYVFSNCKLCI